MLSLLEMLWSIRIDHWFQELVIGGFTRRFTPSGRRSRALAAGRNGAYFWANVEILLAGTMLPGNGNFVSGSRTSLHFLGLDWQMGEPVGKIPVPAESSARFP
jgi:hypothetical protein